MSEAAFRIGQSWVGINQPTYFIADIGANHDGDLSRALTLIDLAASSGADAAKFQHFRAETIVSDLGFKELGSHKSHHSLWEKSVFDTYAQAALDMSWTAALVERCSERGIEFFTSPYDLSYIELIDDFVSVYKVGSGDITWHEILSSIAKKNKPVILATGASTLNEVESAVSIFQDAGVPLALLQCNTNYTVSEDNFKYVNLRVLSTYREKFPNVVLGLSDHTQGHVTVLGAVSLGARIIEKHLTDDRTRVGPDHAFALNPDQWSAMVADTRRLEDSMGGIVKQVEENESDTVILQRRALRYANDFPRLYCLQDDDLVALRPCPADSVPLSKFKEVVGQCLARDVKAGEHLSWSDLLTL